MLVNNSVAISIPAYNDEATIKDVVNDSIAVLSEICDDYEVVVVDDGSTDGTGTVIDGLSQQNRHIRVYHHPGNRGFGGTIKEVFELPKKELIFFIPGDGQIHPREIIKVIGSIKDNDYVLGKRKSRSDSFQRKINSFLYNLVISLVAGKRITDVNSVALLRKESLKGIVLNSRSAFIHAEILLKMLRKGASVTEVEIEHRKRSHGKAGGNRIPVIISTVRDLAGYLAGKL